MKKPLNKIKFKGDLDKVWVCEIGTADTRQVLAVPGKNNSPMLTIPVQPSSKAMRVLLAPQSFRPSCPSAGSFTHIYGYTLKSWRENAFSQSCEDQSARQTFYFSLCCMHLTKPGHCQVPAPANNSTEPLALLVGLRAQQPLLVH